MSDQQIQWLADCEALRALVQRYSRAVDDRDLDTVGALFDPEGKVDGVLGSSPVPEYLDGMRKQGTSPGSSMHNLGEPLIELKPGADEAELDTYATVHQLGEPHRMLGIRYRDRMVRKDGRWLIAHRRTTMLWSREL